MMDEKNALTNNNNENIIDTLPLDTQTKELAEQIIKETNLDTVKDLTHLFNLNQSKKNVLRIMKLNGLLDKVSDQMIERFEKRPGEFSNSDLLSYMQVVQASIDRANKGLSLVDETVPININQNNLNVNIIDPFDRDSKSRIAAAIQAILSQVNNQEEEPDIIEIIDNKGETSDEQE